MLIAIAAMAVALVTTGCGSSNDKPQLSRSAAASLRSDLNQIASNVRAGNCTTAQQVTADLQAQIDGLGRRVGHNLRNALSASAAHLDTLVRNQCSAAAAPVAPVAPQGTSQQDVGNKEKQAKGLNKPKKDKQAQKEKSKEVPPGQDGGNQTTPPGQQGGDQQPPAGDTGGASP